MLSLSLCFSCVHSLSPCLALSSSLFPSVSLSLFLFLALSIFLSLSLSLSLSPAYICLVLLVAHIGSLGVWFRVLGVCRLERTDCVGDVRQEQWERRVLVVIIR